MSFINHLVSFGFDFAYGLAASSAIVISHEETIKKLYSAEPLSIEEFEELYDMRQYNMSSRRSDKKILKAWDEPGVYVLTNTTKDKSYVGKGDRVFRKVFRHINGHGNAEVFSDLSNGDEFEIIIYTLSRSSFDDLDELFREAINVFGNYFK